MAGVWTVTVFVVTLACWIQCTVGSCPAGKFGNSCSYNCHCGHSCNQTTGVCAGDCDKGWLGGHRGTCQKENIAFKKRATSSGNYRPAWSEDKAVDGNRDQDVLHDSCFISLRPPSVWTVNLGQHYRIHNVRIYHRGGYVLRIRNAVLSLSNSSSSTSGVPCYTFPSNTTAGDSVYDVICDGRGQYFTIRHSTNYLNLCEVEIYVCSQGSFGADCSNFCHCSDGPCDRVSGICAGGCWPGWRGQNCSIECDQRHYGANCNEICENRKCTVDASSCDRHTGSCVIGCLPGWTAVDCTQECSRSTYGQNCSKLCTDRNCAGNFSCDHVTGSCVSGCKAGWTGIDCVEVCDQDHYGVNCNGRCGNRNCAANISSCDRYIGSCDTGCLPGWNGVDCTQECSSSTYGHNCRKLCIDRNCASNSSCDHVTGLCVAGCKPGWMGIDCVEACDTEHYGANCDKACTSRQCKESSSCNSTGDCDGGCEAGWTLNDCTGKDEETRSQQGGGYNAGHLAVAVTAAFVVGGVVGAAICLAVVWWRRKRRLHKTSESPPTNASNARTDQSEVSYDVGIESNTYDGLIADSRDVKMTEETYCTIKAGNTDSEAPAATSRNVSQSVEAQIYENIGHTSP